MIHIQTMLFGGKGGIATPECGNVFNSLFRRSSNSEYLKNVNDMVGMISVHPKTNLFRTIIGPPLERHQHPVNLTLGYGHSSEAVAKIKGEEN